MSMETRERAQKDLDKLDRIIEIAQRLGLEDRYPSAFEYARNYGTDAKHFFEKKDYFSSFGAANYAYGYIDCILLLEGKKDETIL